MAGAHCVRRRRHTCFRRRGSNISIRICRRVLARAWERFPRRKLLAGPNRGHRRKRNPLPMASPKKGPTRTIRRVETARIRTKMIRRRRRTKTIRTKMRMRKMMRMNRKRNPRPIGIPSRGGAGNHSPQGRLLRRSNANAPSASTPNDAGSGTSAGDTVDVRRKPSGTPLSVAPPTICPESLIPHAA